MRRLLTTAALISFAVVTLPVPTAHAFTELSDTVSIVKESVAPSNAEIAARLSEATVLPGLVDTVLIGRDDVFADSLASGVLQGESPLLLVPSTGPIPARVRDELIRIGAERAVILGGSGAVSAETEQELQGMGLQTERRAGPTRIETAIAIAESDVAAAGTAILARAFAAESSSDPTQAFADTLAVGAWSAQSGFPVLLSATEALSPATRDYLMRSGVERVEVVGGDAAISPSVEDELRAMGLAVDRTSGADRFATAIEIADKLGAESSADVARLIVADAQFATAWAGGLAAANRAAILDAPIVLTNGADVPPATRAWIEGLGGADGGSAGSAFAQVVVDAPLTCTSFPDACELVRVEELGLSPAAPVSVEPADGSVVEPGAEVIVTIQPGREVEPTMEVFGTCLAGGEERPFPADGVVRTAVSAGALPGACTVRTQFEFADGLVQTDTFTYTVVATGGEGLGFLDQSTGLDARQVANNLVGEDVHVFNVSYRGAPESAGLFTGGDGVLAFGSGIALSSGVLQDLTGPNDSPGTGEALGHPGDADLSALASSADVPRETHDAAVLEFDFVTSASGVRFDYVFGSEEYKEFVDSDYNDVFAFYVNGQNCATVGGAPVSINTINGGDPDRGVPATNSEFYVDNDLRDDFTAPLDIELDGLTTALACNAAIVPGGTNHLKLAIADTTDEFLDAAVFIRQASFVVE